MDLKIQNQFFSPKICILEYGCCSAAQSLVACAGPYIWLAALQTQITTLKACFPPVSRSCLSSHYWFKKKNFHEENNHVFKFLSALCISNCVHNIGSAIKAKKKYTQGVINLITEFCDVALKCVPYKWDFSFNLKV